MPSQHALGLDFGTNSVRAVVADVRTGAEVGSAAAPYRRGQAGVLLHPADPDLARQDPADYFDGLTAVVPAALADARRNAGVAAEQVIGIGVDATASTPIPVDGRGRPLAFDPRFARNLNAMAWLWKDHTSHREAEAITAAAERAGKPYLARSGAHSPEWFYAKLLHCLAVDPAVFAAAHSWMELADLIPAHLVGATDPAVVKRSACAAGHKAMYGDEWGGPPDAAFLASLAPELGALRPRLYDRAYTSDVPAGRLAEGPARSLGLPPGVPVAVGLIDAHAGAVGAGARPGRLVAVLGTSACFMAVRPDTGPAAPIPGVFGIVRSSVIPGCWTCEAGQPATGDILNWLVAFFGRDAGRHERLAAQAAELSPGQSGLLALDWHHGNRSVLADARLTGLLVGLTLGTTPAEVYRAHVEATAFGARVVIDRLVEGGVAIDEVVTCGGVAEKSPLVLRVYADVLRRPIALARSAQASALGAAVMGAVVGGAHPTVEAAQAAMCGLKDVTFRPDPARAAVYDDLFALYRELHDRFGLGHHAALMKRLIDLRDRARR